MPCNITHATPATNRQTLRAETLSSTRECSSSTTIRESGDFTLPSQVPDDGIASATRCCEGILDVMVPGESGDFIKFSTACAGRVWLAGIFQIPDVDL